MKKNTKTPAKTKVKTKAKTKAQKGLQARGKTKQQVKTTKKPLIFKSKGRPLKVVELGQKIIRAKAKLVKDHQSPRIQKLINDMAATCLKEKGVGIAAPQVSVSERLFVVWQRPSDRRPDLTEFGPEAIINPKILAKSARIEMGYEGCLSIPGLLAKVPRHKKIEVSYTNAKGEKVQREFADFLARIFQHEYDHLEGIVYLDRAKSKDIITEKEFMKMISKKK